LDEPDLFCTVNKLGHGVRRERQPLGELSDAEPSGLAAFDHHEEVVALWCEAVSLRDSVRFAEKAPEGDAEGGDALVLVL